MSHYVDKPLQSLVERKREQWAREKEELSRLNQLWNRDHIQSRGSRQSNAAKLSPDYRNRREFPNSGRKNSLPPLVKTNRNSMSMDKIDREMGGETSGYGSDNQTSPEYYQTSNWHHHNNNININNSNNINPGYESSSSLREDRPKWNEKNTIVGRFWEPKDEELKMTNDTPNWVKRGLENNTKVEVANSSPAESPEQDIDKDRPFTSSSVSLARTFIRGQNVHLEPDEIAERERRRQAALQHQEAIKQQLEERERKRVEEREQRIREERDEELRIKRDKEIERQRREIEEKRMQEKIERERKRKEAIQQAMELAKEEAAKEKMKLKLMKQINNAINDDAPTNDSLPESAEAKFKSKSPREEIVMINNIVRDDSKEQKHNNNVNDKSNIVENNKNHEKSNLNRTQEDHNVPQFGNPQMNSLTSCDSLSLVLQTPLETFQNMQFAVLMPTATATNGVPTALPIAVPITIPTDSGSLSNRTENRLLTPTAYRLKKQLVDSSTQTDAVESKYDSAKEKQLKEKLNNLELNYDSRGRKERNRLRETVDERPKWGANRPPTRYMKQSEKDPMYQRRKLRQKIRQTSRDKRSYSPHSSDESQTASPRSFRKITSNRNPTRALWHKSDRLFGENMRLYQTELVPLESDKDRIYYKIKTSNECCCRCACNNMKRHGKSVDILKIDHMTKEEEDETDEKDRLPDYNLNEPLSDNGETLQKLNHLHSGLHVKQEQWRHTPTTPSLTSRRNSENI